jgi:hypothetical protein
LDQNISNLKRLKAIGFDAGNIDVELANGITILDNELNKYQIKHQFEIYNGNHINRIGVRIRDYMLPFFNNNLTNTLKPVVR